MAACVRLPVAVVILILAAGGCARGRADGNQAAGAPLFDHHQHLFSPAAANLLREQPITADQLVAAMDAAGMKRGVVLSEALLFDSPLIVGADHDGYAQVRAENDWTAQQIARFPDRLIGFCSFNPLKQYATAELERCTKELGLKGLKQQMDLSGVDLRDPAHAGRVRHVFEAANSHRLPIVIHVRGVGEYGPDDVETFLDQILTAALDVPVQIAHLWGGGHYSEVSEAALAAYANAVSTELPATRNLFFDVYDLFPRNEEDDTRKRIATLVRRIGVERLVYGSDGPISGRQLTESWIAFRENVPLTDAEFKVIAINTYLD